MISPDKLKIVRQITRYCCNNEKSDSLTDPDPKSEAGLQKLLSNPHAKVAADCPIVQEHLIEYLEGRITEIQEVDIAQHLDECEVCNFIFGQMQAPVNFEAPEIKKIPVPHDLLSKIKNQLPPLDKQTAIRDKVAEKFQQLIEYFELVLIPAPEPAFLNSKPLLAKSIKHEKDDLHISTGKPDLIVRLFTTQDIEIGQEKSDRDGMVVFPKLPDGEYKISVAGHQIADIIARSENIDE